MDAEQSRGYCERAEPHAVDVGEVGPVGVTVRIPRNPSRYHDPVLSLMSLTWDAPVTGKGNRPSGRKAPRSSLPCAQPGNRSLPRAASSSTHPQWLLAMPR